MKGFTIIFIALYISASLFSITHNVFVDGSGDFPTIQEAITSSADGDTIKPIFYIVLYI